MNPRLPNSKKWTPFPGDFVDQIKEALLDALGPQLRGSTLVIEGRIYTSEIMVRVGFLEKSRIKQNNFEVSISYKEDEALTKIHEAVDAAASIMAEFLENGEDEEDKMPRVWREFEFENKKMHFQYTTTNTSLEAEADRLLGEAGSISLVNEDDDVEEIIDPDRVPDDKSRLH